jgi:hypothetical protein
MKANSLADLAPLRDRLQRRQREAAEQAERERQAQLAALRAQRAFVDHVGRQHPSRANVNWTKRPRCAKRCQMRWILSPCCSPTTA